MRRSPRLEHPVVRNRWPEEVERLFVLAEGNRQACMHGGLIEKALRLLVSEEQRPHLLL